MNKSTIWLISALSFCALCYALKTAIAPFFIAFLIAYFIHPLVKRLQDRFGHKTLIIAIIIAALMSFCFALIMVIIPVAYEQTTLLVSKATAYRAYLQPIVTEKVTHLNPEIATHLNDAVHSSFDKVVMAVATSMKNILSYFLATISTVIMIFIIPVILFYLLRDFSTYRTSVEQALPQQMRSKGARLLSSIDNLLSAYIRGQLKVCTMLAAYYSIGLSLIGLDLAFLLGITSGFMIILPFIGFLISFTIALIFGYITFGFSYSMLAIVGLYLFGAALEGTYLTPKIIGDKIGLHPLWIIFVVMAGGTLFGFVGMLLAIPLAGICKILFQFFFKQEKIEDGISF